MKFIFRENFLLNSSLAILDVFDESETKSLKVDLIDSNLANDLVSALKWVEENVLLQDKKYHEKYRDKMATAVDYFTTLSQDKNASLTETALD